MLISASCWPRSQAKRILTVKIFSEECLWSWFVLQQQIFFDTQATSIFMPLYCSILCGWNFYSIENSLISTRNLKNATCFNPNWGILEILCGSNFQRQLHRTCFSVHGTWNGILVPTPPRWIAILKSRREDNLSSFESDCFDDTNPLVGARTHSSNKNTHTHSGRLAYDPVCEKGRDTVNPFLIYNFIKLRDLEVRDRWPLASFRGAQTCVSSEAIFFSSDMRLLTYAWVIFFFRIGLHTRKKT